MVYLGTAKEKGTHHRFSLGFPMKLTKNNFELFEVGGGSAIKGH